MELTAQDFGRLADIVHSHCGIKLPATKKLMLEGRLRRRAGALGHDDLQRYCRFLFDDGGLAQEFTHLIDAVTTNKTDFFREPRHFEYLVGTVLPGMLKAVGRRPLALWSAACSTGQEPYTLAMVLAEAAASHGFDFTIRATDISRQVLDVAMRAVFPVELAEQIPPAARSRWVMRSRDGAAPLMRIAPEIRGKVGFRHMNLLDAKYPWREPMDVIFCRNVLIYFDRPTQQAVLSFLCDHLRPGGYLFLGHSETLSGLHLPVRQAIPSVFERLP